MFSLVVTVMSIALGVCLSLAAMYYGANAWVEGSRKSMVSSMVSHAQQISSAIVVYKSQHGEVPSDIGRLVEEKLLNGRPKVSVNRSLGLFWNMNHYSVHVLGIEDIVFCNDINLRSGVTTTTGDAAQTGAVLKELPYYCEADGTGKLKFIFHIE